MKRIPTFNSINKISNELNIPNNITLTGINSIQRYPVGRTNSLFPSISNFPIKFYTRYFTKSILNFIKFQDVLSTQIKFKCSLFRSFFSISKQVFKDISIFSSAFFTYMPITIFIRNIFMKMIYRQNLFTLRARICLHNSNYNLKTIKRQGPNWPDGGQK